MARATLNPGSSPGQTTDATPGVSDKAHSRRAMLGRVAAAAPAIALAAVPALAGPADPHVAWATEAAGLKRLCARLDAEEADRIAGRICDLEILIAETPAATLDGVREQLAVTDFLMGDDEPPCTIDHAAVRNALATLDRLAGRA